MSDKRISELDASGSLTGAEILPLVQSAATKRGLLSAIADYVVKTATSFLQSGSGAQAEDQQSRGRWTLFVTDYMSVADRASLLAGTIVDVNTAADNARTRLVALGGGKLRFPAGSYYLDNWRYRTDIVVKGDGAGATRIHQQSAGNPAIYCLSDVTTGQLISVGLLGLTVVGHATATVPAVKVEATTPYVVTRSEFDYQAEGTYGALEIVVTASLEVYLNRFKVHSVTASSTAFITEGVYNRYGLTAVNCSGQALIDASLNSTFDRVVTDNLQTYNGQNNTINTPTVETIYAGTWGADTAAIAVMGYNNTVITPIVQECAAAQVEASFRTQNFNTFIGPRVLGTDFPTYSVNIIAGATTVFIGGDMNCGAVLRQHVAAATLAACSFVGDCSSYLGGLNPQVARLRYPVIPIGDVAYASVGTNTVPVAGTIYLAEIRIDTAKDITGVGVLNGGTVGTDKHIVALFDSDGTMLATSALAGTTTSGANAFQEIAFTTAYRTVPGRYWIGLQMNGTTDRLRTIAASTYVDVLTKSSTGAFGTVPNQTVPTTFTADTGPVAYVY